jgi:regulator of protease activity HflC (stomatin/prohibitin superfamily)
MSKNRNLIRIDMRPAVLQIAQGLVTSDQLLANLRCMVRIQVKDPKAVIEGTRNYRDEGAQFRNDVLAHGR